MASGHAARQWLEAFKFAVYVTTPIAATVYLGTGAYPYLSWMINSTAYIVYPAAGPTPPKNAGDIEEMRRLRKEAKARGTGA